MQTDPRQARPAIATATRLRVIDSPPLAGALLRPQAARALVLLVHPDSHDRRDAGQRFIADVLVANGLATLSLVLRTPEEEARGAELPAAPEIAWRLRQLTQQLATDPDTRGLPLALVGVHEAASPCAQALALGGFDALCSRVWLDARVELDAAHVASWTRPTLCLAGRHGIGAAVQPLRGIRRLPSPHRLVKLSLRSRPQASAGVHQAMACELLAWLQRTLPAPTTSAAPQPVRVEHALSTA